MTLREKLLGAVDSEAFRENVSDSVLLDIVLDQLAATKRTLHEAQSALIKEGMAADEARRNAHAEISRARNDPARFMHGDYYFTVSSYCNSPIFIVSIGGGSISLFRREGRIDYNMQQMSREEYAKRVLDQ
jgi:hypothetical protein